MAKSYICIWNKFIPTNFFYIERHFNIRLFNLLFTKIFLHQISNNSIFESTSKGNYQSQKATDAIIDGGFFGKGIGEGTLNTRVPEAHTDYVISVISEEFGIFLILIILFVFLILVFRTFKKISYEKKTSNKLILIGSSLLIVFQVLIHVGVNIKLLPTTGMTLPFLSYGGSSILSSSILAGLILNFTKRRIY